jgi:hypothetical protein
LRILTKSTESAHRVWLAVSNVKVSLVLMMSGASRAKGTPAK